jgi:hypothetical protein
LYQNLHSIAIHILSEQFEVLFASIKLCEPALDKAPEALDAINMYTAFIDKAGLAVLVFADTQMVIITDIDKPVITAPVAGDDHTLHIDLTTDNPL